MIRLSIYGLVIGLLSLTLTKSWCQENTKMETGIRKSPVSYHLSFDNDAFFKEDFLEQSGKKSLEERSIDFPEGKFGKGIRMKEIPQTPDANNMTGIDLDLVTAVIFNTHPGNQMGFNQPFIWGSGRINARLGGLAFWAKGDVAFAGPLFEQTSVGFGRKERDLLGVVIDEKNTISAYVRDARYQKMVLSSEVEWDASRWNHLVLNWDWANGLELWLNGKIIASSWGQQAWFETTLPGLFHLPAAGISYDEFYLFDRPITVNEIADLVNTNKYPGPETLTYRRPINQPDMLAAISGANQNDQLPRIHPGEICEIKEVWPEQVGDGHIPGWFVVDGRNEIPWPHPYSMFTIIPGDADFHAEKVDLRISNSSKVNFVTLTGNLTNVKVQACTDRDDQHIDMFKVPAGDQFFYGSTIKTQTGANFRIPFTEKYGTPQGFSGNIHVPLSGEKRIQNIGLYYCKIIEGGEKNLAGEHFEFGDLSGKLDTKTQFAIHALTSRDERNFILATKEKTVGKIDKFDIGNFSRLNLMSEPYENDRGIKSISLELPIKTDKSEETLFVRVRDPAVPSRFWNQFAIILNGFNKDHQTLRIKIDFQDIVVAPGDRLWVDLGTAGKTEISLVQPNMKASWYVEETAPFLAIDAYVSKEIIAAQAQYAKMYEFMPWQFTGREVSLTIPYCYGGPFDMILPALAIKRVKPDHFISNYLITVSGMDYKDGKPIDPAKTVLINLENPLSAPDWALYMRDFNIKREAIVDWWSDNQNEDGQLGGGWNDDVLFLSFHQPDLPLDGNDKARYLIDAAHLGLEKTNYFKDGYCNIYPMDRMHIGDFISERYNTVLNNLGQAYAFERELESAWRLGKIAETPINYFADGFKSSVNIFKWFWGMDRPQKAYQSKSLDELAQEFRLYTSVLDNYAFYRFTESNVHRDDFSPYGANNMYTYLLGGRRGTRLDAHMELAVTWPEGGGAQVSRVILTADDTSVHLVAYNFQEHAAELVMRLCRIEAGSYRISIADDPDGSGKGGKILWEQDQELRRFDRVTLPVPAHTPVSIKVEQLSSNPLPATLPDLAIDPWDATFSGNSVRCVIHNLGNEKVENVIVRLADGDEILQEQAISSMLAPVDFQAKRQILVFDKVQFSGNLQIIIDPENVIQEILEENNSVFVSKAGEVEIGIKPVESEKAP